MVTSIWCIQNLWCENTGSGEVLCSWLCAGHVYFLLKSLIYMEQINLIDNNLLRSSINI